MSDANDSSIVLICEECADQPEKTKICRMCKTEYCSHFASKIDISLCNNELADFVVTETTITKTVEVYNPKGEVTARRVQHANQLTLNGNDWLFVQRKILEMDDQDLLNTIEYHRACASIMLNEREHRRTEKANALSKIKVIMPKRETQYDKEERQRKSEERDAAKAAKLANGGTKTTRTSKKAAPDLNALADMLKKLAAAGLTPEMILSMTGKK